VSTWLAAEPRAATNPESFLQLLVLLPVLDRCPHEQAEYEEDGRAGDDREDYLLPRVHSLSLSSRVGGRGSRRLVSRPKERSPDHRRRRCEESPDEERRVIAAVQRGQRPVG
jgi:hypothetical protein